MNRGIGVMMIVASGMLGMYIDLRGINEPSLFWFFGLITGIIATVIGTK